jgi:hypothetical protein
MNNSTSDLDDVVILVWFNKGKFVSPETEARFSLVWHARAEVSPQVTEEEILDAAFTKLNGFEQRDAGWLRSEKELNRSMSPGDCMLQRNPKLEPALYMSMDFGWDDSFCQHDLLMNAGTSHIKGFGVDIAKLPAAFSLRV